MGDAATTPGVETKTIVTPEGRNLAYVEVGDPGGPLVIHNHGAPGSRFEARLFADVAARNHLRLIGVDRPGMGQSSPQEERTFAGWAQDTITVADALGYREFGVTGWSGGGPWALAAAAYIDPARLRHVSCIAGASYGTFGENWANQYLSKIDAIGGLLALHFEPGFRLMYKTLDITAVHFRDTYLGQLRKAVNDYDRQILLRPEVEDIFCEETVECFAQGSDGLVRDSIASYQSWPFDVTTIERPVHLWQGLDDAMVPHPINQVVAERMPGAVWHPVEGAGHFVAIGSADEIFAIVADELGA
jgi:pimeloyl-ACP methyl ester carboxylesterase